MGIVVSDRGDANEMVVTGQWTRQASEAIASGQVDRLILNHALGFREQSLGFLQGAPLRELVVIDPALTSLDPIHTLGPTLRVLSVSTNPKLGIDLERLPRLRKLAAAWSQVEGTVNAAKGLGVVLLRDYDEIDLAPLSGLSQLTELVMKDRPRVRTLAGLGYLPLVEKLGIHGARNLTDIDALSGRAGIRDLAVEGSPQIDQIGPLEECTGLESLNLGDCGDLASLSPITGLRRLEVLLLFGSTRVLDDDLSPIERLGRLRRLRMRSRNSYRPTVEQIQERLSHQDGQ